MKITYSSTLEDHIIFNHWFAEQQPEYWRNFQAARVFIAAFVGIIILTVPSLFNMVPDVKSNINMKYVFIGAVAGTLLMFLRYPTTIKKSRERCIRNIYTGDKGKNIFCKHTLEIDNATLIERTEFGESSQKFSTIGKIVEIPGYILIMIGASQAHVIPIASMEDGDLNQFISDLRVKLQSTQS